MSTFYFGTIKVIKIEIHESEIQANNCGSHSDCTVYGPSEDCSGGSLRFCNPSVCAMQYYIPAQSC